MSDFDAEAERERLRKKYERDKQKREATEKMSELLLQGATMTNAHCSECGDPVFRYDGQEFCATCERTIERSGTGEGGESQDGSAIEVTSPDDGARVSFGGEADGEEHVDKDERLERETTTRRSEGARSERAQSERETRQQDTEERTQRQETGTAVRDPRVASDVGVARDSLVRTLIRFSEQAEETDDPRRAREYLAAAREAAETLAVLRK